MVTSVLIGVFLLYPILAVPLYDCIVLGNLLQGWRKPCGRGGAAGHAAAGDEHLPAQPPALAGGRRAASSRNLSSGAWMAGCVMRMMVMVVVACMASMPLVVESLRARGD